MKKLICCLLLVVVLATMLTACGKFKCDMCNEEKSGEKHETEMLGKEVVICDDCYEDIQDLADAMG